MNDNDLVIKIGPTHGTVCVPSGFLGQAIRGDPNQKITSNKKFFLAGSIVIECSIDATTPHSDPDAEIITKLSIVSAQWEPNDA